MRKNRKKLRLLALLLAALTLCGCSAAAAVRRPAQPQLQLYYCRKDSGDTKTGVLGTQEVPAQTDPPPCSRPICRARRTKRSRCPSPPAIPARSSLCRMAS